MPPNTAPRRHARRNFPRSRPDSCIASSTPATTIFYSSIHTSQNKCQEKHGGSYPGRINEKPSSVLSGNWMTLMIVANDRQPMISYSNYVTVVEDRPITSVKYCLLVPVFHFWPELTRPAARSLCNNWATCCSRAWDKQIDGRTDALIPASLFRHLW